MCNNNFFLFVLKICGAICQAKGIYVIRSVWRKLNEAAISIQNKPKFGSKIPRICLAMLNDAKRIKRDSVLGMRSTNKLSTIELKHYFNIKPYEMMDDK